MGWLHPRKNTVVILFSSNTSRPHTFLKPESPQQSSSPKRLSVRSIQTGSHLQSQSCPLLSLGYSVSVYLFAQSCVRWHKWSHGSRGSSPTGRVCLGSFGVCTAQTSQAAGLGSVSHWSIFQSSGWQIYFNTSVWTKNPTAVLLQEGGGEKKTLFFFFLQWNLHTKSVLTDRKHKCYDYRIQHAGGRGYCLLPQSEISVCSLKTTLGKIKSTSSPDDFTEVHSEFYSSSNGLLGEHRTPSSQAKLSKTPFPDFIH